MRKTLRVTFWTVVALGVIVGGLRLTIIDWWTVPDDDPALGASIAPSLWPGDVVLLYTGEKAKFGDLVRCTDPEEPRRFVIGRVLGEPGDVVEVVGSDVVVNGRRGTQEMLCTEKRVSVTNPVSGSPEDLLCSIEENGGKKHMRVADPQRLASERKVTVSEGNVYLVSDNRAFPLDSRNYGAVPRASCKELIFFRLWGKRGAADVDSRFTYVQ